MAAARTESGPPAGVLVVDKPSGWTSHQVVGRARRVLGTRKIGHAGTLDPMATGVLVLGVGRATRLLGQLALTDKAYDATIRLGQATVTDDAEGELTESVGAEGVSDEAIETVVVGLRGPIEQVPSAVSAIKVDGQRAYARVRAGEEVALEPRTVTVHELVVSDVRQDTETVDLDISLRCSSGTYVRAIARDLGAALGVGGHLTALRRTAVGPYDLAAARTLDELSEGFALLPIADAARAGFASVDLGEEQAADVRVGRALDLDLAGLTALFDPSGEFLALYEPRDGRARAVAVFV